VERLQPRWQVDEEVSRAVRGEQSIIGRGEALSRFLVANNALKREAADALTSLSQRLAVAERTNTELFGVIADIREAAGVGAKPMLTELAATIKANIEAVTDAEDEAKDAFWAIYPDWVKTHGHGLSTEAGRTMLGERLAAAEARLAVVEAERNETRKRFSEHVDYSIDLSRIIEALCDDRDPAEPRTPGRVHYNMAIAHRRAAEAQLAHAREAAIEDAMLPFAADQGMSLEYHAPVYEDDPPEPTHNKWVVWRVEGNINDREWIVVASGDTPAAAIRAMKGGAA
jgi:hypothetical protein